MCKNCATSGSECEDRSGDRYTEFLESIKKRFSVVAGNGTPLFTTNAENLFEVFLSNLPTEAHQHYTCNTCRHFVNRYGSLVTITQDGEAQSILWGEVPVFFTKSIDAVKQAVLKAKVTGVFMADKAILGLPITGEWHHMSITLPRAMVNNTRLKNADQLMAEKSEEFRILIAGLTEYPVEAIDQALTLLKSEALYRSDRFLGITQWLKDLHAKRAQTANSKVRDNITWLAAATAPVGFCHIKSSMIGTLLDDIVTGLSFDSIKARFIEKMDPSQYQRSQTAPTEGGIRQAEQMVEKLGIANSLRRRYATFDEIPSFLWKNNSVLKKDVAAPASVFGGITPRGKGITNSSIDLPSTVMTWDKFQRTVLPSTESIEVKVDNANRFMALVTASDETAQNILQWDNPFSWYYHGGIDGEIKRRVENAGGRYENNEIRCSLIWEGYTDLDLHCVTARGEHIYYGDKRSGTGWLDIDMNGGSHRDAYPVENIRWSNSAPIGNYRFYVHNYCERGKGVTPFKVELEVNGKIYVYNGVASGTGFHVDVFKFNYIKGQQINIVSDLYSSNDSWNVPANDFVKVKGITNSPNLWGKEPVLHSGTHIFFILDGCRDLSEGKGRGFFTEMLKPDLREIRKTLEAYTANTPIENANEATSCGVGYSKDSEWNLTLKVTSNNSSRLIKIDRWD